MTENPTPPNAWLLSALRGVTIRNRGQLMGADLAALAAGVRLRLLIRTREPPPGSTAPRATWRLNPAVKLCDDALPLTKLEKLLSRSAP
jgi:hypothetical protein